MASNVSELREMFENKLKSEDAYSLFHPNDIERIKNDRYVGMFLSDNNNDLKNSLNAIWETFLWRKKHDVNDINETNINMDFIKKGVFYPYGKDLDGCTIFVYQGRLYHRGMIKLEDYKRCVIYWFERLMNEDCGRNITFLFNAEGTGLSNTDLDVVRFLVSMLSVYPNAINYLIGYDVPWVLNAMFKLIKQLLPQRLVDKLKMLNKNTISKYVDPKETTLNIEGGNPDYKFVFQPSTVNNNNNNQSPLYDTRGSSVRITPYKSIEFKHENNLLSATLRIQNVDDTEIAFKVRTTAPDKFVVSPGTGIIKMGDAKNITISLQCETEPKQAINEKFLVLVLKIPKGSLILKEQKAIWSSLELNNVEEHKFTCKFPDSLDKYKLENVKVSSQVKSLQYFIISATIVNVIIYCLIFYTLNKSCD